MLLVIVFLFVSNLLFVNFVFKLGALHVLFMFVDAVWILLAAGVLVCLIVCCLVSLVLLWLLVCVGVGCLGVLLACVAVWLYVLACCQVLFLWFGGLVRLV